MTAILGLLSPLWGRFAPYLIAGAVGMARLRLGAHEPVDVYRGYAAGFAAVLVAQAIL